MITLLCQILMLIEALETVKNVVCQNHCTIIYVDMCNLTLLDIQRNAVIRFGRNIVVVIFAHYCWY